jgi:hypothetical protein
MDSTGKLIHVEVWAVNFSAPSRKERREERLTVWVTEDGGLAEILHLDHWRETDEQSHETKPAVGSVLKSTHFAPARWCLSFVYPLQPALNNNSIHIRALPKLWFLESCSPTHGRG